MIRILIADTSQQITENIARRCFLFERFIEDVLANDANALAFDTKPSNVVIHAHCHAKARTC